MTYPVKSPVAYNYIGFQAGNPTTPLPANQVSADLANHKTSIDTLVEFAKLIQRSDGNLQNGAVKPETLSAAVIALIGKWTPRGTWLTATAYAVNDLIEQPAASGNNYVALVAHTSGVFATDLAAGKWMLLDGQAARLAAVQTFTSANTFAAAVTMTAAIDMTAGTPTVPTAAVGDSTPAAASTAFIQAATAKVYRQVFTSPPTPITMTIASPAVLSWAAHGLPIGGAFQLATTGALPTGVSINTTYYVIAAGYGANSFQVAATPGGAAIVSTGSQSGTHTGTPFYVPRAGMVNCIIECWGGGGGGAGSANQVAASAQSGGGGGGAGSYSRKLATAAAIGASAAVTIGAAGTGGSAGANNGGAGGDTSAGSLCIGKGGSGGVTTGAGGAGGVAGTGDVTTTGMSGSTNITLNNTNGTNIVFGGSSSVGGGGAGAALTGVAGTGRASGGQGATSFNNTGATAGGAGTAGYLIVTEFCNQ
jgi:hypothetical protein